MHRTFTRGELRSQLETKWESVPFWTTEDANDALNEALRTWNLLTGAWKDRVELRTIANEHWYSLPSAITYRTRVEVASFPLDQSSLGDLDYGRPSWESETTEISDVPRRPSLWAPAGLTLIVIWPAEASAGRVLVVDGVARTPFLSRDEDFVDLGEFEHQAILGFALHVAAFKEGGSRFDSTRTYRRLFLEAAADKNARLRASAYFRHEMGLDVNRDQRPMRVEGVRR